MTQIRVPLSQIESAKDSGHYPRNIKRPRHVSPLWIVVSISRRPGLPITRYIRRFFLVTGATISPQVFQWLGLTNAGERCDLDALDQCVDTINHQLKSYEENAHKPLINN